MASIRERENRWQARVTINGRSIAKTFTNKAEATKWARQQQVDMERGWLAPTANASCTLGELLERYLTEVTPTKRGAGQERYLLRALLRSDLETRPISEISPKDLAAWRDKRLGQVSQGSVRRELDVLSAVFTMAQKEWQLCDANPIAQIRKPAPGKPRDRRLLPGELERIIAATQSPDLPVIITLALETAMRRSEILGLLWKDLDLKRRVAHLSITKNGESRDVPLSSRALALLASLPRRVDGRVFRKNGTTCSGAFQRAVKRARHQYELDCIARGDEVDARFLTDLRFHDIRHEATTWLFERGLNQMEVASITGHKTLAMLSRYTHLKAEKLAEKLG